MNTNDILEIYERHGALQRGHFKLSSGLHSDTYLQSALVMQYPVIAETIIAELVKKLYHYRFWNVVSPAVGGIRFGYELARLLKKRSLFTERVDGVMQFRRGFHLDAGERVMIAEDVVTTGKSTRECIEAVRKTGAIVVGVTCLVDRSGGEAKFDVPFHPLISLEVKTYDPAECPMCAKGEAITKPGSRVFDPEAGPAV